MSYGIARLNHEDWLDVVGFHLYDQHHKLRLVADFGTPWLLAEYAGHVRFARPSGQPIASMDMNSAARKQRYGRFQTSHAMILDHAVYAILNKFWDDAPENETLPYFVVEVADHAWLLLGKSEPEWQYKLYAAPSRSLAVMSQPDEADLPEPTGHVYAGVGPYDYQVEFEETTFAQPALMALAAVFLINFGGGR